MSVNLTPKELERALRERSPEAESEIRSLLNCDRRHFLKVSAKFAALAAAAGVIQPHAFQLVEAAYAQPAAGASPDVASTRYTGSGKPRACSASCRRVFGSFSSAALGRLSSLGTNKRSITPAAASKPRRPKQK